MDKFVVNNGIRRSPEPLAHCSSTADAGPSCSTSGSTTDVALYTNPWPYLESFFEFICEKDSKNLKFRCKLCEPKETFLSINKKSLNNFKAHLSSKHTASVQTFENLVDRKRKRIRDGEGILVRKLPRMEDSFKTCRKQPLPVSQNMLEDKIVSLFVENMIPLHVSSYLCD